MCGYGAGETGKTASAVEASFAGAGVQRAASPLCRDAGAAAHCWGQGAKPIGGLRAASPIGSRVKRLAQGKLMPASTYTGYYLTQNFAGLAALPPSLARNIFAGRRKNV
ncbi:MAG: hypothetical protein ACLVDC_10475 [Blautia hansenii]